MPMLSLVICFLPLAWSLRTQQSCVMNLSLAHPLKAWEMNVTDACGRIATGNFSVVMFVVQPYFSSWQHWTRPVNGKWPQVSMWNFLQMRPASLASHLFFFFVANARKNQDSLVVRRAVCQILEAVGCDVSKEYATFCNVHPSISLITNRTVSSNCASAFLCECGT